MNIDDQIDAAMMRCQDALRAKGYPTASASIMAASGWGDPYFASLHALPIGTSRGGQSAKTFDEAVDKLLGMIADLPHRWSDADVAATLGIGAAGNWPFGSIVGSAAR